VRLLCRELVRDSTIDVLLATRRGSELARRAAAEGVRVHEVPWGIGLDPRAWWYLGRALRRFRPGVIHVHDSHSLTLARAALGGADAPALVAHRRVDFHVGRRSAWRRATHVIAVSEAVKAILAADGMDPGAITVIPDGIDPDEVRTAAAAPLDIRGRLGLPGGTPLAVNVAALVDHKDQRTLIHAAREARAAAPDLHWAVAGDGPLGRSLAAEIARLELGDRVHLLGYIDGVDALIREGDVFVMSSKEEGMGSVVLHALALGRPVVATRAGGLPEFVPAEWLVPVGDAAALARTVVEALRRPSPFPLPPRCTARAMAQAVRACYRRLA
jgi:glycosyltransferase involved in cell wall biosynthesis